MFENTCMYNKVSKGILFNKVIPIFPVYCVPINETALFILKSTECFLKALFIIAFNLILIRIQVNYHYISEV